jgi:mannose-6-phosphate isomerase-like protein (cupin superfamily)
VVGEAKPQPYKVRAIYVVAKGADVLVREYTLDPGEAIPWHRHTEVSDYYYGLEGMVVVETREPRARYEILVGQSATVRPPTVHQVSNPGKQPCRFLLVQGVGKHDFVKMSEPPSGHGG